MREVFAAQFRDRVVHHLIYNYIAPLLIPGFIRDSYSCIPGRGTHDGIFRLEKNICRESRNYSSPCYVLKLDIQGYFMHIDRRKLLNICLQSLEPFRARMDYPLVKYLLEVIVLEDPTLNCRRRGFESDWDGLPDSKTLFCSPPGCGLPIGNLTSQLFSNVYMDLFDKYMVSLVGDGNYGRYVDDAYVVGTSKEQLRSLIPLADSFLRNELGLTLSRHKVAVYSAYQGVEFLGAYLKPYRIYISNRCLKRMEEKIDILSLWLAEFSDSRHSLGNLKQISLSVNSFLGITSHYRAYNIRLRWARGPLRPLFRFGYFTGGILTFRPENHHDSPFFL